MAPVAALRCGGTIVVKHALVTFCVGLAGGKEGGYSMHSRCCDCDCMLLLRSFTCVMRLLPFITAHTSPPRF